jgi:hypothetical protein
MVKSAPTPTAMLTQDDGGGHTGWGERSRPGDLGSQPRRVAESWYRCYVDQFAFELEGTAAAPSHP